MQIYAARNHQFMAQQYLTATYCRSCQGVLWGIGNQGYQCVSEYWICRNVVLLRLNSQQYMCSVTLCETLLCGVGVAKKFSNLIGDTTAAVEKQGRALR